MADLVFVGQFVASKVGATGLTVTVDIDRYTLADGTRTALVTAGSATEGRRGLYHYRLASADLSLYQYVATFITASAAVDQQEIAAIGLVVPDVLVSSRSTLTEQQARDASKLAPSPGAPAAGSVDAHLDDILEDTGTTLPALIAAVDSDVWAYVTRTLTQSSTSTTDSTAAGSIVRRRGDSWSISLTIGAITGYTSLWFTAKWSRDDTDEMAVLQIKKNASGSSDGLLYVNGAAATDATKASITIVDAATGAIVIVVDETITDDLPPAGVWYDVQVLNGGSVSTPDSGTLTISADVTRAVA